MDDEKYVSLACNEMSKIKNAKFPKLTDVLRSNCFVLLLLNKSSFLVLNINLVLLCVDFKENKTNIASSAT